MGSIGGVAHATGFTTVDISSYLNSNVAINPQTLPVGTTTGNQGTGIPIQTSPFGPNGYTGTWNAIYPASGPSPLTLTVPLTSLNITGQASFYALLNNYYGTPGADEYNVTITATNGDNITYESIGGYDTRDYNSNIYTNTIAHTTTAWFNNGIGQRLDIREFSLPTSFADDTIASFTITQVQPGDAALFSGLTFSSAPIVAFVPEPATWAMMLVGFGGLGVAMRSQRRLAAVSS